MREKSVRPAPNRPEHQQRRFAAIGADIGGMLGVHFADARLDRHAAAIPEDRLDVVGEEFVVRDVVGEEAEDRRICAGLGQHRPESLRDRRRGRRPVRPCEMLTGRIASIGVFLNCRGDQRGPAIIPNPPPFLLTKSLTSCKLRIGKLPRIDIAEQDDVVVHQLFDALGESARIGLSPSWGKRRIGTGEQAGDVDRLIADHLVLDVAIFPARITIDIEHVDLGIEHGDLRGADVVLIVGLAGLLYGFDDEIERCRLRRL